MVRDRNHQELQIQVLIADDAVLSAHALKHQTGRIVRPVLTHQPAALSCGDLQQSAAVLKQPLQEIQPFPQQRRPGDEDILIRIVERKQARLHLTEGLEDLLLDPRKEIRLNSGIQVHQDRSVHAAGILDPIALKDLLQVFPVRGLIVDQRADHMVHLGPADMILHLHLMLPEQKDRDPLHQTGIAPHFRRLSRDSDDCDRLPLVPDRLVDAAPGPGDGIVLGHDFRCPERCGTAGRFMKSPDPGCVGADQNVSVGVNKIDVIIAD